MIASRATSLTCIEGWSGWGQPGRILEIRDNFRNRRNYYARANAKWKLYVRKTVAAIFGVWVLPCCLFEGLRSTGTAKPHWQRRALRLLTINVILSVLMGAARSTLLKVGYCCLALGFSKQWPTRSSESRSEELCCVHVNCCRTTPRPLNLYSTLFALAPNHPPSTSQLAAMDRRIPSTELDHT